MMLVDDLAASASARLDARDLGIPTRTEAEWLAEIRSTGMLGGEAWSRGFASDYLLPYRFVRPLGTRANEVSYDGETWRKYNPKIDRGIR